MVVVSHWVVLFSLSTPNVFDMGKPQSESLRKMSWLPGRHAEINHSEYIIMLFVQLDVLIILLGGCGSRSRVQLDYCGQTTVYHCMDISLESLRDLHFQGAN